MPSSSRASALPNRICHDHALLHTLCNAEKQKALESEGSLFGVITAALLALCLISLSPDWEEELLLERVSGCLITAEFHGVCVCGRVSTIQSKKPRGRKGERQRGKNSSPTQPLAQPAGEVS